MLLKKLQAMQQIICLKSAVLEMQQPLQVGGLVLGHKLIGGIVHQLHEFFAFGNDGSAVAPGKNGSKEAGNFNVLQAGKGMRYTNRIGHYKSRLIVLLYLVVEESDE